ncbi:hypothetical protein QR680_017294 [Steinernema hermaphroditum]|uniref:Uncharacterized protein n=1 Tax=Steinernema hermaphroditum TaxID=289476 RepID=A0AA39HE04_9BILA|nr:hypothetical protein QR680_017294 [Steinernema hermaphroditum]
MAEVDEVLLRETPSRFVVFPLQFKAMWQYYKRHIENFWTADEMEVQDDVTNFDKLSHDERTFIIRQFASLCATVEIFHRGLISHISSEVQVSEARSFYGFQMAMERFHLEVYQKAIESFVAEGHEREQALSMRVKDEAIKQKVDWALSLSSELATFDERLIGFSVILGVLHAAEFASLMMMSVRKNLVNVKKAITHIAGDKALHRDFGMFLRTYLVKKTSESRIKEIVEKAVQLEEAFVESSESVPAFDGVDVDKLNHYIRFSADMLMAQMGCKKIYNVQNPFDFMETFDVKNAFEFSENIPADGNAHEAEDVFEKQNDFDLDMDF